MEIVKRTDGWWIIGIPDSVEECGPYSTRQEAEADRRGLAQFFKHENDPRWWSDDRKLQQAEA